MNDLLKSILILGTALGLAVVLCLLIIRVMPKNNKSKTLQINDAEWIGGAQENSAGAGSDTGQKFPIKLGYTIQSQLPAGTPCCSGSYHIRIPASISSPEISQLRIPAIYLPAIGGIFKVVVNGIDLKVPFRKDYSSVGPLIPIDTNALTNDLQIEIAVSGPPTPFNGLWNGPLVIGDYFSLFDQMENDRRIQIYFPTMNGIGMILFSILFLFLYYVSQRQAEFFLRIGVAFAIYATFDMYLSGYIRHQNLVFGFLTHYPMLGLVNVGKFLIVYSFLELVGENAQQLSGRQKKITFGLLIALSILNFILGFQGNWAASVWLGSLSLLIPFWPLVIWPYKKSSQTWIGFFTLVVALFALFSSMADAVKLTSRLFQFKIDYGYFSRYTTIVLIITAIILSAFFFKKLFITLERDRLKMMKSQGINRAIKMLAHDLRKPFTTIKLGLATLEKKPTESKDDYARKLNTEVSNHLNAVNTMLADMMDFGGICRLAVNKTDVSELVRECIDETTPNYNSLHIELCIEVPEGLSANIDRMKIRRVLQNVLHNAYQAVKSNGQIKVTANRIANGKLSINIFNTNSFLTEEKIDMIFDDFYTSDKADGTGLGLAIAKEFVEAHGGDIFCSSVRGEGTLFRIRLP